MDTSTVESMTEHIMNELNIGAFDCPEIKCGFIGEVGSSYPILGKVPIITYYKIICYQLNNYFNNN